MKTISRDGKHRRPRKGDPVFVFDSQGRRRIVPRLEDVHLRFRWSKFGSGMELFYVWHGKEHLFHTLFRISEWYKRGPLVMDAAKMFCIEEYGVKHIAEEKKKAPRRRCAPCSKCGGISSTLGTMSCTKSKTCSGFARSWSRDMGWATYHIQKLQQGLTVQFRPHGPSMAGKIESGQLCTVAPCDVHDAQVGDIVLCKVRGSEFLHLVKALRPGAVLIGNNRGHLNGWTRQVYGKCVKVED